MKEIIKENVECISGCDDKDEENSKFCKSYIYDGDDDNLDNPLLDETYVNRKSDN